MAPERSPLPAADGGGSSSSSPASSSASAGTSTGLVQSPRAWALRRFPSNEGLGSDIARSVDDIFELLGKDPERDRISLPEFRSALQRLRLPSSGELARTSFEAADNDDDGQLSHADLLRYATRREEEIVHIFRRLTRRDGRPRLVEELSQEGRPMKVEGLDAADLKLALHALGVRASDAQVRAFLHRLDTDESGAVSLREFGRFVYLLPDIDLGTAFKSWAREQITPLDTGNEPGQLVQLSRQGGSLGKARLRDDPAAAAPASSVVVFAAGAAAGAVSRTATAPLDRLKMLMQVGFSEASAVNPRPSRGVISGLRLIYAQGGFLSFFQGNTANVIKVMPESGVRFWVYDAAKSSICADPTAPTVTERLCAGACAGATSCVAIYPLEVAKTRIGIAAPGVYRGIWHCMRTTAAREGPAALFKGLAPSLVGIIPFSAVDLALYNTFKQECARLDVGGRESERGGGTGGGGTGGGGRGGAAASYEPNTLTMLGCGALSSSIAGLVTYPLALAKTRMQAAGMPGYEKSWSSLADCLLQTVRHEGPRGLYRGIVPNLLKAVPSISISYVVFETAQKWLRANGW
jgi:solute carrier family 25 phosphate transporter 23/24/25/41